jgi:hypothetical protein
VLQLRRYCEAVRLFIDSLERNIRIDGTQKTPKGTVSKQTTRLAFFCSRKKWPIAKRISGSERELRIAENEYCE